MNYTLYSYLILIQTRFCMLLGSFPFSFCLVLFCFVDQPCYVCYSYFCCFVVYFVWLYVLYIYVYVTRVLCCQMLNKESRLKKQKKNYDENPVPNVRVPWTTTTTKCTEKLLKQNTFISLHDSVCVYVTHRRSRNIQPN